MYCDKGPTSSGSGGKGICRLSPSQPLKIFPLPSWWHLNANELKPKHWLPHYQSNLANKSTYGCVIKAIPDHSLALTAPTPPLHAINPLKFCLRLHKMKTAESCRKDSVTKGNKMIVAIFQNLGSTNSILALFPRVEIQTK